MKLSDRAYDMLKWIGLIAVPIITFATAMVNIWRIPYGDEIVASLAALDICIGAIVTIAKVQYEKKQKSLEVDVETDNKEVPSEVEEINEEEGADA